MTITTTAAPLRPLRPGRHHVGDARLMLLLAVGGLLVGCGGSDTDADTQPPTPSIADTQPTNPDTSAVTENATDAETDTEGDAQGVPSGSWDGPDAATLLDARIDELDDVFGAPLEAASLASLFEIPDDFAYPMAAITGVAQVWDLDHRVDDELNVEIERLVGTDAPGDADALDAVDTAVEAAGGRWSRSSSQRQDGQAFNDLYTTEDGGRMVLTGEVEPDPGEPTFEINVDASAAAIPLPSWAAGLPLPEGGEPSLVREGVGIVSPFFAGPAGDGDVELRLFFAGADGEQLASFYGSGILAAAGFERGDTPMNLLDFRQDVTIGAWSGTVAVGEVSTNGEVIGHEVIWSLRRS